MNKIKQTFRKKPWLSGLVIILLGITMAETWMIFKMQKSQAVGANEFKPWSKNHASHLLVSPSKSKSASSFARRQDDPKIVLWESSDDLQNIHDQINKILNNLLADFGYLSSSSAFPEKTGHAPSALPTDDIRSLQQKMNNIFKNAFNEHKFMQMPNLFEEDWDMVKVSSAMNIEDMGNYYMITAAITETDKSNIEILLQDRFLSISTHQNLDKRTLHSGQKNNGNAIIREQFKTEVMLPGPIDAETAEATIKDNMLCIRIPKRVEKKPVARVIKVR